MVTAKKKRYPGCLAHAVLGMFYSVVANQRQPQYTYNVLQRRCQPRPTVICILDGGAGEGGENTATRAEEAAEAEPTAVATVAGAKPPASLKCSSVQRNALQRTAMQCNAMHGKPYLDIALRGPELPRHGVRRTPVESHANHTTALHLTKGQARRNTTTHSPRGQRDKPIKRQKVKTSKRQKL